MFIDLVGSTAYNFRTDLPGITPKVYQHNPKSPTRSFRSASYLQGITVQLLGDGLMAYFDGENCCNRALACALGIIEELDTHNAKIEKDNRQNPEIWKDLIYQPYIGIHYGRVWFFRFEQHTNLDPLGPTVDLASRLQPICPRI